MDPMQLQALMMIAQNPELAATMLAQAGVPPPGQATGQPRQLEGALGRASTPQAAAPTAEGASPAAPQAGLQQFLQQSMPFVQAMEPRQLPPPPAPAPFVRGPIGNAQTSQQLMQMLMAGAGGQGAPSLGALIAGGQ